MSKTYPIPEQASRLEQDWAAELAAHLGCTVAEFRADPTGRLTFPTGTLRVELMDGSFAEFNCAFALVSEARKAIAVFTEHCGHHLFPNHDARVWLDGGLVYEWRPG